MEMKRITNLLLCDGKVESPSNLDPSRIMWVKEMSSRQLNPTPELRRSSCRSTNTASPGATSAELSCKQLRGKELIKKAGSPNQPHNILRTNQRREPGSTSGTTDKRSIQTPTVCPLLLRVDPQVVWVVLDMQQVGAGSELSADTT